jgi:hypothetical protein
MKKLLIIALLIVGCDNSTEPEDHPLVGVWEEEYDIFNFIASECSGVESYSDTTAESANSEDYHKMKWDFNANNTMTISSDEGDGYTGGLTVEWTTSASNRLILIMPDEDEVETFDYSITGNFLRVVFNEYFNCETDSVYSNGEYVQYGGKEEDGWILTKQ